MIVLFSSCKEKNNSTALKKQVAIAEKAAPNCYFDYDEILYYNLPKEKTSYSSIRNNRNKSHLDSLKAAVLVSDTPQSMQDLNGLKMLKEMGFVLCQLEGLELLEIDKIFTYEKIENCTTSVSMCPPIYRDILIFKKDNEIVGVAKICFSCLDHQLIGSPYPAGCLFSEENQNRANLANLLYY